MSKSSRLRERELRFRLYTRLIEVIGLVVHRAIPCTGIVLVFFFLYLSARVLAGQQTFATVVVKFFADFRVRDALAYGLGLGGVGYGLRNRKLRKDSVEQMADRIKILESQIDVRRSSSRLTRRGETRPEDKP